MQSGFRSADALDALLPLSFFFLCNLYGGDRVLITRGRRRACC